MQSVLTWSVRNKQQVITVFKTLYAIVFMVILFVGYCIATGTYGLEIYTLSLFAGRTAIVLFCITITPGILRRFSIRGPILSIIMLFRRYLGISTFSFGFLHYVSMKVFPAFFSGNMKALLSASTFEFFGVLSLYTMMVLFFTSNDWSTKHLGKWWNRIHRLVYVIAWTLFIHVFLQRVSTWSILIGTYAILETVSLIYYYLLRKPTVPQPSGKTPTTP